MFIYNQKNILKKIAVLLEVVSTSFWLQSDFWFFW